MQKYLLKRLGLVVLAVIILLVLVFFLLQALPGYPIPRSARETEIQYLERVRSYGLLDNPMIQFGHFLQRLFTKGEFGQVYNNAITNTVVRFTDRIKYSVLISLPAFVISSIIGVSLGIVAAYFRGKWIDSLVNGIAVLFVSIPSFIFALYLVKLSGVIGLPIQFQLPQYDAHGHITNLDDFVKSIIMPILAITLSSISVILYYTRNELVDVFKQDYIKTALSKGLRFRKIVFTHALRSAGIPIAAILMPSFISVLSGSIIVETFFNVPGVSTIIVNAIQTKEIYLVLFATVFYSGIYFTFQIFVDLTFTIIDPRVVLAERNPRSLWQQFKIYNKRIANKLSLLANNRPDLENLVSYNVRHAERVADQNIDYVDFTLPTVSEIHTAYNSLNTQTVVGTPVHFSEKKSKLVKKEWFRPTDNLLTNSDQIAGKPSTYLKDLTKRFFKSKAAFVFTIILAAMLLMAVIIPLMTPHANNQPVASLTGLVSYLPPRIPALGLNGVVPQKTINIATFEMLKQFKDQGIEVYSKVLPLGSSYVIYDYNPYLIPTLKDVYPVMGTDSIGRDWWDLLWYSTAKSLTLAIIASAGSVAIGATYGAISGIFAGKWIDNILMRLVEILSGVPTIIWVLLLAQAVSGGSTNIFTIALALMVTSWMWPAVLARTYVLKYKDADFVAAAQTLGASKARIIFSHLLPNIAGRLLVSLVNSVPGVIFFESSLVFLGLGSTTDMSLGLMINTGFESGQNFLLVGPTLTIVLITLASQNLANNLNDSIDPKIVGA